MTRRTIMQEGVVTANGMTLHSGALYTDLDIVPVCWLGHYDELVGRGSGFERDALGHVSFDVELNEDFPIDHDRLDYSFYCTDLQYLKGDTDWKSIASARIRAITVWPLPFAGFPEFTKSKEQK